MKAKQEQRGIRYYLNVGDYNPAFHLTIYPPSSFQLDFLNERECSHVSSFQLLNEYGLRLDLHLIILFIYICFKTTSWEASSHPAAAGKPTRDHLVRKAIPFKNSGKLHSSLALSSVQLFNSRAESSTQLFFLAALYHLTLQGMQTFLLHPTFQASLDVI